MLAVRPLFAIIQFENVENPWLWLALTLAGAGILFVTYRSIARRSERRLAWWLMLLRGAGLAALGLALAKPTWTGASDLVDPARVAVVLDNSQSMSLADTSGTSRYALAKDAIEQLRKGLKESPAGARMQIDLFDIKGAPLEGGMPEQPTVERTDLARALSETAAKLRSRPLAAMVLISDGMDNSGTQDFDKLSNSAVPLYTVGFRPADAGNLDLAVRKVHAPERAMVNNEVKVELLLAKLAGPATEATVFLKRGREEFARKKVSFAAAETEKIVNMTLTSRQAGSFVFTASIDAGTGERNLSNNTAHFPLRVDAEPIRVLYLEGFLRHEYKFLKNRLEDDPDISLVSIVRRANPELTPAKTGPDLLTPERLKNFDVVILGDMEASYLSGPEYLSLVKWVGEKSHALLVLGGYNSFGPTGFRSTPLAKVLPVDFVAKGAHQSEEPFVLQLTEEGRRHPMFEISGDRIADAATWKTVPPLLGMSIVQGVKPGAEVLAVNPAQIVDGKPAVVVASQRYEAGHTMVLTADTTWRWSRLPRIRGQADTLYARFWSQTLRWLSGRSVDAQRPLLTVSTDKPAYDAVGQPVKVRVVLQPRPGTDLSSATVGVEITGSAGKPVPLKMEAGSAEPDAFSGTFAPSSGGRYEVAASLAVGGKQIANQAAEFLVHGSNLEMADTGTNRELLKVLAGNSGGRFFDVDEVQKLANQITSDLQSDKTGITHLERRIPRVQRTEFWNSPALFMFFLACVTGEWFLRRRNHLV